MLESEWKADRFLASPHSCDRDDLIRLVNAAVRAVLAERSGRREPRGEPGCQLFLDKLMSVRQAELLPRGTRVVQVGPQTVITPLALDFLKRQGIAIRLGGTTEAHGLVRGQWAVAIDEESGGLAQALRRSFLEDPRTWTEIEPSLEAILSWLVAEEGRGAMWITSEVALAVWKSCRCEGVRAASAVEPADVHNAVRSLRINLLVADPTGKSISWIKQLASAFRMGGAPGLPDPSLLEPKR